MAKTTSTAVMTPEENKERLANLKNDKKWIRKMFLLLCYHITQMMQPERMLGCSMMMLMNSARDDIYPGDVEKQIDLVQRHAVFFNTQQGFGAIIWGIMLGMEIENARTDGGVPNDMIQAIKTALASPIAGIGDSLGRGTIITIIIVMFILPQILLLGEKVIEGFRFGCHLRICGLLCGEHSSDLCALFYGYPSGY